MKTAARTTIPQQAAPSHEDIAPVSATRRRREGWREGRPLVLAIASVFAAIAAVAAFTALVLAGGDDAGSPSPDTRVVAPGPAVDGSDQHLKYLAPERQGAPAPVGRPGRP